MKHDQTKQPEDLTLLRQEIDRIDRQMMTLFAERMTVAEQIAAFKQTTKKPVYDALREEEHLSEMMADLDDQHQTQGVSFAKSVMRLSRTTQYRYLINAGADFQIGRQLTEAEPQEIRVQCAVTQGSAGAYAEQACRLLFPDARQINAPTFQQACDKVRDGSADVAVLPLENSTAGTVDDVYEALLKDDLHIWRSLSLMIQHHLLGIPGSNLQTIQTVVSHPQALAQCSELIHRRGWSMRESLNTAFAAEQVAAAGDPSLAAIGSAAAAKKHQLVVLKDAISNTSSNQTRFVVVGRTFKVTPDAERISLILKLPHAIGALAATLSIFSDCGLNLSKIQSRPDPDSPWRYLFYLDFECSQADLNQALAALYQLYSEMPYIRLLGWYHEIKTDSHPTGQSTGDDSDDSTQSSQ